MKPDWMSSEVVLERGGPYEVVESRRPHWQSLARKYASGDHPAAAKERVAAVWISGEHRPAWLDSRKIPDIRGQFHGRVGQDQVMARGQDLHSDAGQGDQPVRSEPERAVPAGAADEREELRVVPEDPEQDTIFG